MEAPTNSGQERAEDIRVMKVKETVRELLERLPDDCTLEEVLYHLYVLEKVERGLADADAGRTLSHAEVANELRSRWQQSAAK